MRFFNAVAAIALGLAAAAHGRVQIIDRDVSQSAPTSATAPASASASQLPGGVFISAPLAEPTAPADVTSSSKDEYSVGTSMPASSATAVPQPQPQPTTSTGNFSPLRPSSPFSFSNGTASTNTLTAAGSKCSKEGQYNCQSDGKAYQRCAAGLWSITMPVALGNPCKPGLADTFVSAQKRSSPSFVRRRRFVYEHSRGKRASSRLG